MSDGDEGLLLHGGEDVGCACSFGEVMERQEDGVGGMHAGAVGLSYNDGSGGGVDIFTWDACTDVVVCAPRIGYGAEMVSGGDR